LPPLVSAMQAIILSYKHGILGQAPYLRAFRRNSGIGEEVI